MPASNDSWSDWFRKHLAWSNSRESWYERLAGLVLLCGAAFLVWKGGRLPRPEQVMLWGLLFVALAVLLRRGWLRLFGPVLFYDMVRNARRGRFILDRCVYALLLLLILGLMFRDRPEAVSATGAAKFAEGFFKVFMTVQWLVIGFLTPAYTAGAIAEEKERKTLEFVLATDLRNREIVLSKLVSRLANLTLIVLTGLPITLEPLEPD